MSVDPEKQYIYNIMSRKAMCGAPLSEEETQIAAKHFTESELQCMTFINCDCSDKKCSNRNYSKIERNKLLFGSNTVPALDL